MEKVKVAKKPPRMKVSRKGAVVIPREIRERLGIREGSEVFFLVFGDSIRLVPVPEDVIAATRGMLKGGGPMSGTEGLLADRRWELEQEERVLPPPRRELESHERQRESA